MSQISFSLSGKISHMIENIKKNYLAIFLAGLFFYFMIYSKELLLLIAFIGLDFLKAFVKVYFGVDVTIDFIWIGAAILSIFFSPAYGIFLSVFPMINRLLLGKFKITYVKQTFYIIGLAIVSSLVDISNISFFIIFSQAITIVLDIIFDFAIFRKANFESLFLNLLLIIGNIIFLKLFLSSIIWYISL